jgi:hypothetical protein
VAALVVVEAVAIALLGVLVVGLLRSHAEILRTLHRLGAGHPLADGSTPEASVPLGPPRLSSTAEAVDLVGTTPAGEAIQIGVRNARHDTLVAFLSSGCGTCGEFWRSFATATPDVPPGTRLVIVTKSPAEESVSRLRELAPATVPVVMSTQAWQDYGVPVTPYFLHVDGPTGKVAGQGTGGTWSQVRSLFSQSRGDDEGARARRPTVAEVEAGVDRKLLAAGIRPGDPSLYPSRQDAGDQ